MEYTKATLKTALQDWNTNSETTFVSKLDEIIRRGELRLAYLLDLENLDSVRTVSTVDGSAEVFKPDNLVVERMLTLDSGASRFGVYKRHRGWIEAMNADGIEARPEYYAEYDEDRWNVAPIADDEYLIYVHGIYQPASIVDGGDNQTTWFSTRVPDLLFLACSAEACEYLKFWAHKAANEAELTEKSSQFLGIAANLQRADFEDIYGLRVTANKPSTQRTE